MSKFPMSITESQKQEWLVALRSGNFQQGKGFLCCEGRYCCLGVLAEVLKLEKKPVLNSRGQETSYFIYYKGDKSNDTSLRNVLETDLTDHDIAGTYCELINKNDKFMESFGQIADWIEKNLIPIVKESNVGTVGTSNG